jgi:hypothetical protein
MKAKPTQDERASAVKPNSDDVALHNGKIEQPAIPRLKPQ